MSHDAIPDFATYDKWVPTPYNEHGVPFGAKDPDKQKVVEQEILAKYGLTGWRCFKSDEWDDFKKWASRKGVSKRAGIEISLDGRTVYDARHGKGQDIVVDGHRLALNGQITWGEAVEIILKYFSLNK